MGTSARRLLDQQLGALGRQPTLAVVSAQCDALLPLVVAGAAAALVPEPLALIAETLGAVIADPHPRQSGIWSCYTDQGRSLRPRPASATWRRGAAP